MPGTFDTRLQVNKVIQGYTEATVNLGVVNTGVTLTQNYGTVIYAQLTASTVTVFTMPPALLGKRFTLVLTQANTGSATAGTARFTNVRWPNSPGLYNVSTLQLSRDIISFISDGVNWYGIYSVNYSYGVADKAIFGYGYILPVVSMTNLVSNTGVVATDVTGVGTARYYLAAAGY